MQDTTMTSGSPPVPMAAMNGQSPGAGAATAFTGERVQELVAALEEPFDPSEIKWRVTNTCKIGGPKGPATEVRCWRMPIRGRTPTG